jgi:2'-5' RNA ligase/GNAT superfamily N-acetyltransferase
MPRWRLGVALLVPPPARDEVDGLRRALGDPALPRIPAHLTLVPPVNVREDAIDDALAVLRAAAATVPGALHLTLGAPATFLPHNPVLFLPVDGDLDGLHRLRDAVFKPPLERPLTWPFVPHVTVADDSTPQRIEAARTAMADFAVDIRIDRVHLLREGEHEHRVWRPIADVPFGPPAVVGRGGLPLELSVTERLDPEAAAFSEREWDAEPTGEHRQPIAVTARREGKVVGTAEGRIADEHAHLSTLIVAADERGTGVGAHLVNAFLVAMADRGARHVSVRTKNGGFYRRLGWVEEARHFDGFVQYRRDLA